MAVLIGFSVLVCIGALIVLLRIWPMINVVETGRTPEYPDIAPRAYRVKADRVFDAALHAIHRMPRWLLVSSQEETGDIRAEARTRIFQFVDDIAIRIVDRGEKTVVEVRSASRIGRGDFGQNARNIRAFFEELDRQVYERTGEH
ncbi:MAG: hypothetical protein C4293_08035 [Nitrospiraceae bacterium]